MKFLILDMKKMKFEAKLKLTFFSTNITCNMMGDELTPSMYFCVTPRTLVCVHIDFSCVVISW
jgi:hypothetical protein